MTEGKIPINKLGSSKQLIKERITCQLSKSLISVLDKLQVHDVTSSTNDLLMTCMPDKAGQFVVSIANQQTAGRGRNGSVWQSPPDENIYMSVGVMMGITHLNELGGLSLACGVALARMFDSMGINVGLKWPNDILFEDKKLAGILVETRVKTSQVYVIVGVGVNINMSKSIAGELIDQPWADVGMTLNDSGIMDRNQIAAQMMESLISCLKEYMQTSFASFNNDWHKYEILSGRNVIVKKDGDELNGTVMGINSDYSLKVRVNNKEQSFYAADIKLKMTGNN